MQTAEASARQEYLALRERMILLERELQQQIRREELEQYKTRAVVVEDKVQQLEARAVVAEDKVQQLEVTLQELRTLLDTVLDDPFKQPSSRIARTSVSETPSPSSGLFLSRAQSWKIFFRREALAILEDGCLETVLDDPSKQPSSRICKSLYICV